MHDYVVAIIPVILTAIVGGLTFMVRGYMAGIFKAIDDVRLDVVRVHGELKAMHQDVRENTIAITKATTELRAVWRYIDNAPKRASDGR